MFKRGVGSSTRGICRGTLASQCVDGGIRSRRNLGHLGPEDWEVGKPHGQIQLPANFNGIVPIAPWFQTKTMV